MPSVLLPRALTSHRRRGGARPAPALAAWLFVVAALPGVALAAPSDDPPGEGEGGQIQNLQSTDANGNQNAISREEAIAKILNACKENPNQSGCVKLRAACEEKRGQWQNDMARMCPELVGNGGSAASRLGEDDGGETYGEPRPRDKNEATLDKVARMCHAQPDNKVCVQVRDQCRAKYDNLAPGGQRLCRQIGAAPTAAADSPTGLHAIYTFQYAKTTDSDALKGIESLIGGHIAGRGYSSDSILATQFELTVAQATKGWFWEGTLCAGLGFAIGAKGRFGLVGGLRGSGITKGGLEAAWGVPVEANLTWSLAPKIQVLGYVRPIWNLGDTKRVDGGLIGDEFEIGGDVVYGKQGAIGDTNLGVAAGVMLHQMAGSNYIGLRLGFAIANRTR